jgi:hypothetical protein
MFLWAEEIENRSGGLKKLAIQSKRTPLMVSMACVSGQA